MVLVELGSLDKDEDHHEDDEIDFEPASAKATSRSISPTAEISCSPSSKAINMDSDDADSSPHQWHGFLRKIAKGSTSTLHGFHPTLHSIKRLTRKKSRKLTESIPALPHDLDAELHCFEASWTNFSLADLQSATDNFSRGLYLLKYSNITPSVLKYLSTTRKTHSLRKI